MWNAGIISLARGFYFTLQQISPSYSFPIHIYISVGEWWFSSSFLIQIWSRLSRTLFSSRTRDCQTRFFLSCKKKEFLSVGKDADRVIIALCFLRAFFFPISSSFSLAECSAALCVCYCIGKPTSASVLFSQTESAVFYWITFCWAANTEQVYRRIRQSFRNNKHKSPVVYMCSPCWMWRRSSFLFTFALW